MHFGVPGRERKRDTRGGKMGGSVRVRERERESKWCLSKCCVFATLTI